MTQFTVYIDSQELSLRQSTGGTALQLFCTTINVTGLPVADGLC